MHGIKSRNIFAATTDPGITSMTKPVSYKGCAILVPGQYRSAWKLGYHKGKYEAIVQYKPVKVYRDNNKDAVYDFNPKTVEEGTFGINIHKAGKHSTQVDNWSAGCQVLANKEDNELVKVASFTKEFKGASTDGAADDMPADEKAPEDIKEAAVSVLRHRVMVSPEREMEGLTADEIIKQILESIEIPR